MINSVQKTLGLLHQLHLTVFSFSVSSQLPLLQRLNALVSELDNMQSLIDEGKNPDEYTRDVINSCISRTRLPGEKLMHSGYDDSSNTLNAPGSYVVYLQLGLRKHLLEELEEAFPDEVESYRAIRASSAAESKRLTQSHGVLPNGDAKVKTEH